MTSNSTPTLNRRALAALLILGLLEAGLAVTQWAELEKLRRGDETFCAVSDVVSCSAVWTSPLAVKVTELARVPIAGLGVAWGLSAVFLAAMVWAASRSGRPAGTLVAALRLCAAAGLLSVVGLAAGSLQAGAVCPTCLGTYALVAGYAAAAFFLTTPRTPARASLPGGAAWALAAAAVAYGVVLLPARALGSSFPTPAELVLRLSQAIPPEAASDPDRAIAAVLEQLSPQERQLVSESLALYRMAQDPGVARAPRVRWGPADAPLRLVDFTDVRCPHCKHLEEMLSVMKRVLPAGRFSVEARHYPLDSECNPRLAASDGQHVRCAGAAALICLEGAPDFWAMREKLFAAQASLTTPQRVLEVASSGSMARADLVLCMQDRATAEKLKEDLEYAEAYKPRGTPMVLLNGRAAPYVPAFIYLMALTGGRTDLPAFATLPSPRAFQ
jgi:serine/threonine-protein kinase